MTTAAPVVVGDVLLDPYGARYVVHRVAGPALHVRREDGLLGSLLVDTGSMRRQLAGSLGRRPWRREPKVVASVRYALPDGYTLVTVGGTGLAFMAPDGARSEAVPVGDDMIAAGERAARAAWAHAGLEAPAVMLVQVDGGASR